MSVATKNPFALLDAEGSRPSSPPPTKPAQSTPAPAAQPGSQKPQRGGPAARGGKYYNRGGGAKKPVPGSGNPNQDAGAEESAAEGQRRFENNRGGRGRGSRGGPPRGGRRPFDKHSQTGKTDSDKKYHQGWGGDDGNTELKTEQQATADAVVEGTNEWAADSAGAAEWATPPADAGADAAATPADGEKVEGGRPRREREPEEEDNTLTLDQYLAQQKEKDSLALPKLEGPRQANEGANTWKDVVPLEKTGEDSYFAGKTKAAPKARAKKEEKVFLEIDARFERPDRGGRGRGRGGDRGRGGPRGRGGSRGGRSSGNQLVNVDDQTAFPSLS